MTALVKGLALGVSPGDPETELYAHGDEVVIGTPSGDIEVTVVHHEPPWVEVTDPPSGVGWVVHERTVSRR